MQEINAFTIIATLILYGLTFLCFFIPFKKGQRQTGYIVGVTLAVIIIQSENEITPKLATLKSTLSLAAFDPV